VVRLLPVHRRSMYFTPYGNPVACQRGPRLQVVQPDRVGCSTTLFHIASISLRSNTSWSCAVGGGFVRKQPDPLLGCLEDRTLPTEAIELGLSPDTAEWTLRLPCHLLHTPFLLVPIATLVDPTITSDLADRQRTTNIMKNDTASNPCFRNPFGYRRRRWV
jgi:hypothetical protein